MAEFFNKSFVQKLIYVYRINDSAHEGILKVGEASCKGSPIEYLTAEPNSKILNDAARERIRHQTQTAGVTPELLYTEKTAYEKGTSIVVFQDHEVHNVLVRSGVKRKYFDAEHKANEWFYTDLETVKKAIAAVKEGRKSLNASEISTERSPVILRKEQREAVDFAKKRFGRKSGSHKVLWNAKMRFGKTLSALQLIKECDIRRTLILTHRPVVDKGWFEDYEKIFYDRPEFDYGSKQNGSTLEAMERLAQDTSTSCYIYFASIQDMRGSELVGGNFAKNEDVFGIDWDLIIIDEAHEGTKTELGTAVLSKCRKKRTRELHLSGTPFNLMDDFEEDEIYTWDYVMEQRAKAEWDILHQGDPNPYACLPRMNIFTYDLGKLYPEYADADIAFNFREFFRVDEKGDFIHEVNVRQFLDLIAKEDDESNYPFSTAAYRDNFRHSLWMVPGVREARALSRLLQSHPVFGCFEVVNVAGNGDEEVDSTDALKAVETAMTEHPENTYTITLSCGRLTTGVSVKPWTACFMLSGSYSTAASSYMQTIFRVQTPATIAGRVKEECFVFDFAPDRTLKVIAESVKISRKAGETTGSDRQALGDFINFCPIIGFEGSRMKAYDTEKMLGQLKKVYVERVVRNGFEDSYLYNNELLHLDNVALKEFDELQKIIGTTKAMPKTSDIDINSLGFTEEEFEQAKRLQKEKRELTAEEEEFRRRLMEARKNRDTAISILRGISIRMPLLIYGADLQKNLDGSEDAITIDNFTDLVDNLSWQEFMPNGVTKEKFNQFKKYYDSDVFREAGIRIREMAKAADRLCIEERIERISSIFSTFRNPDKETVLTPWRVVNMHLTESLGGWCFYDEKYKETLVEPRFVEQGDVTGEVYKKNTHILEINSKSGLYALYCAYSVFRSRKKLELGPKAMREQEKELWKKVLAENIYVICKTPMAKSITKRTLAGFSEARVNAHYFEDLVSQLKHKADSFVSKVTRASYWKKDGEEMKFDTVVGNPPYQEEVTLAQNAVNGQASRTNIFQHFQIAADNIASGYTSLIYPAVRWLHRSGKGLQQFGLQQINQPSLKKIIYYEDAHEVFKDASLDDGVSIVLKDMGKTQNDFEYVFCKDEFVKTIFLNPPGNDLLPLNPQDAVIINKVSDFVSKNGVKYLHDRILSRSLFGIESDFVEKNIDKVIAYNTNYELKESEIKLLANDKAGPAGRSRWFVVNRELIKTNKDLIEEFQVVVSSAHPGGQAGRSNQIEIIDDKSAFGRSRLALASFKTIDKARNFFEYCNTIFIRFMFLMTDEALTSLGKKVPDIMDYSSGNKLVDFTKNLDQQLFELVGLSDEEVAYIVSVVG